MCQKARLISGFPNKELIKRRKTRVGNSLESKLASDCHKLCLFIQGGSKDEISDLFVTEKSGTTDIVSSQGRESDLTCSSQPAGNQINTDIILNATADILALRNDLNDFKTESEKSAERFSKMIKDMKTNHSRHFENIQKDLNSQMQENNKLRTYYENKIHECENSISMCQNKLTSQAETISQLEATNAKLTTDLKNCCEFQNCLDAGLKTLNNNYEKMNQKTILASENQSDIHGKIEYLERTVEKINSPRDHEVSCLKGELKVYKQKVHEIREDSNNNAFQCNSLKSSVTQLRTRVGAIDKCISDVKSSSLNKEDMDNIKEQCNLIQAKLDSLATNHITTHQRALQHNHHPPQPCKSPSSTDVRNPHQPTPQSQNNQSKKSSNNHTTSNKEQGDLNHSKTPPRRSLSPPDNQHDPPTNRIPVVIHPRGSTDRVYYRSENSHSITHQHAASDTSHGFVSANKSWARPTHYYIGNINSSVTPDMINSFLERRNISTLSLRVFNSKRLDTKGARLSVNCEQASVIEAIGFWPKGVYVRLWHD